MVYLFKIISRLFNIVNNIIIEFIIVMLATADDDGLPGHISGIAQLALFIFMSGIQIALTIQEWLLRGPSHYVEVIHVERYAMERCTMDGVDKYSFLYKLSYAMLLLLLQIFINPFIVTSQRNYKEGLLFTIGSICLGIVWIGWIIMYIVLGNHFGPQWLDKSICSGLLMCSTTLIITIFIPKVRFSIALYLIFSSKYYCSYCSFTYHTPSYPFTTYYSVL